MGESERYCEHLRNQDVLSLPYRTDRLRFLMENLGEHRHLLLPEMAYYYFEEVRTCYINGAYVACVLLVQAAIEDILRDFFRSAGMNKFADKSGFKQLIGTCVARKLINEEEAERIEHIRRIRNPYTHTKRIMHRTSLFKRMERLNFEKEASDLMREDAESAILSLFDLLKRYPLSFCED